MYFNQKKYEVNMNLKTMWSDFQDFTYSKQSHLYKIPRFGEHIGVDHNLANLKLYQDIFVYNFIVDNLPPGSKLLEVGGGNSRIIEALKQQYEIWNVDKFEGVGNGPLQISDDQGYHLVSAYMGEFSPELPDNYFDCVFSLSTLEHVYPETEENFKSVCDDINRVLKAGGLSLHLFDVVSEKEGVQTNVWTNKLLLYIFQNIETVNQMIPFAEMQKDRDLYVMSEAAYNKMWEPVTHQSYQLFGKPLSYNVLWKKKKVLKESINSINSISSIPSSSLKNSIETNNQGVSVSLIVKKSVPKISIVTPSFNQGEFLEECIQSILEQGYPNLEYIIMDGGSKDNSIEIIKKYEKYLSYWQSQPDGGQYIAINDAFKKTTGEIMAWLNSDDKYHQNAFFKVASAFTNHQEIQWLTGRATAWDRDGRVTYFEASIPKWSREYLLNLTKEIRERRRFIQQESTFWKRSLWEQAGSQLNLQLELAGDFELWVRFSRYASLFPIDDFLGGFRSYEGQRSKLYIDKYMQEVELVVNQERLLDKEEYTRSIAAPEPIIVRLTLRELVANKNSKEQQDDNGDRTTVTILEKGEHEGQSHQKDDVVIVTSIAPKNQEKQRVAIDSWQALGFSVVSLNIQSEIDQLQPLYQNVLFHAVTRDAHSEAGRPLVYLDDVLLYLRQRGTRIGGIINSDICLRADSNFRLFIAEESVNSLVFGNRINLDSIDDIYLQSLDWIDNTVGKYEYGFDYFFFDTSIIDLYPTETFCIGMPWWDYWMPAAILPTNVDLKLLDSRIAYHVVHPTNFSDLAWRKYGMKIAKYYLNYNSYAKMVEEIQSPNYEHDNWYSFHPLVELGEYILEKIYRSKRTKIIKYCPQQYATKAVNVELYNSIQQLSYPCKVSAIVSTYNSEKFIRGRLENLVNQTLYTKGQLEIIVIDSNSEQNERSIVKEFQNKYPHIIYERTPNRETIYAAWNRGIKMCHGQYLINANADDRLATNALEIMANKLDDDSHLSAVYGDWLITAVENDSFDSNSDKFNFYYPESIPPLLLYYQITTHAALIKRSVFDQIGYYRDDMKVFGDREFMLRFYANGLMAKKIPDIVGLYHENLNSISMGEVGYTASENEYKPLRDNYLQPKNLSRLFGYNSVVSDSHLAQLYAVLGAWGKDCYIWKTHIVSDINFAEKVFCKALELDQTNCLALNNLGIIRATQGNYQQATEMLNLALQHSNSDRQNIQNNIAAVNNQCNTFADYFWVKPSMPMFVPTNQLTNSSTLEKPLVSVIIPTKDRPEMLAQAIQSVLNQTFTELEIIVVNDGGVDVQAVISPLNTRGNIVYKKHNRALERSAARNTGIRAARGKYIAYLDDDDNYYPNHIETLVKFLENSEYKIAYTDAVMAEQKKQNGEYVTVHRNVPYSLDFDKDKILVSNCTPNLCLMHEKSCLDEVGLFDETLSTHEDWDLIIRLSRKFDIAHIKETTCEFTQRNDGTNTSSHNRPDFTRTREIIFNRYRQYAEANPTILEAQKEAFIAEANELAQQVQNLQSQVVQKESQLQQTQAEKSQLSVQVETWQRTTQEVQAKLDATQSEKEWVKSQLNSWKQTAEEMQIELDRSRSKLKQAQSQLNLSAFPIGKS
ncbi:glycosyltransferase [Kamptonema animale]|jgi:glycosyltransferase involved in cell wall biosynthesis/ubiquinone/menaquinone biosynthesis C-methylase UbiE|uniref:glycosyltransferase n=1 Tax=Kamptonema animale TaxID=92934 RepID=UPI00232C025F|nr:glycosyltransferase [Kamptonema animale]